MDEHVRSYEVVSQSISSTVRKILRAFAATIVPALSQTDEDAENVWEEFENIFEDMLRQRPANVRRRLGIFFHAIQWLPLIRYGRPFTMLNPEQRTKFLRYLQNNRIQLVRSGFWKLRTLCFCCYYGQETVARAIGYFAHLKGWEALQ